MAPKLRRRLVIDASVARASGGTSCADSTAAGCRDFLLAVRKTKHRMATSHAMIKEWNRHQSDFARQWRAGMERRGRVELVIPKLNADTAHSILATARDEGCRNILEDDMHLLEAALATDRTVASLDDRARNHFAYASVTVQDIADVCWVNPGSAEERLTKWLSAGAKPEAHRMLSWHALASP